MTHSLRSPALQYLVCDSDIFIYIDQSFFAIMFSLTLLLPLTTGYFFA